MKFHSDERNLRRTWQIFVSGGMRSKLFSGCARLAALHVQKAFSPIRDSCVVTRGDPFSAL